MCIRDRARCDCDVALARLDDTGENLQESRLSGTVGANQTIAIAFGKLNIHIFKECAFANAQSNIICTNHR